MYMYMYYSCFVLNADYEEAQNKDSDKINYFWCKCSLTAHIVFMYLQYLHVHVVN